MADLLPIYGPIDVYLTGNPQITYFKNVYRRYTNFSKESKKIYDNVLSDKISNFTIPSKCADLLNGICLIIELDGTKYYKNDIDAYLLKSAEFFFDNECIQKITNDYINISNKLLEKKPNTKKIGNRIMIDIPFWFNEISSAIPLIALQKTNLTLKLEFNNHENIKNLQIIGNYVFLDN